MRFATSIAIAVALAGTSIATEPRASQSAAKPATRSSPNDMQRVLARLAARDCAMTNDVATLLTRPQPDLAQFMLNRLPHRDSRGDVFVGAKLRPGQPQSIPDRVAEIIVRPTKLIGSLLEPHLPTIPILQRIEAKLERKAELRRDVLRNLTLLTSPQPLLGIKKSFENPLRSLTLPSPHYLESHNPQYFPEEPDFPLPRELAYQEETAGLITPAAKKK